MTAKPGKPTAPHTHKFVAPAACDGTPPPNSESPLRPTTIFTCACGQRKELVNSMRTLLSMQGTRFGDSRSLHVSPEQLKQRRDALKAGLKEYAIVSPTTRGLGMVMQE